MFYLFLVPETSRLFTSITRDSIDSDCGQGFCCLEPEKCRAQMIRIVLTKLLKKKKKKKTFTILLVPAVPVLQCLILQNLLLLLRCYS